jgi:hypothetical protein
MLRVVEKPSEEHRELRTTLDEVLQRGALKMLQKAREAEVEDARSGGAGCTRPGTGREEWESTGAAARDRERHAGSASATRQ